MFNSTDLNMPKVSVLLPVYNTNVTHLRDAIESILSQTYTDFELLIINDASTDIVVEETILSYKDSRIKYQVNLTNVGITHTRNKLIDMAQGQYLAVMDHDDISLADRLKKQVSYLDNNIDIGVVSCNYEKFRNKNILSKQKKRFVNTLIDDNDIRVALIKTCALIHPAAMIRRSVLIDNNIRYENRFSPAEDYALWCRLIPHTKFHNIPEVLFRYRVHSNNTSRVQKKQINRAANAIQAFVANDNPLLYKEHQYTATSITKICLFGIIPIAKLISTRQRTWVYFLNIIPILYYKKISN